jgi:phage terminase large subunit-like protein
MFDPSMFPPDKWKDLSYWEQISLLPSDEQEEILRKFVQDGVAINSSDITFRRKQKDILKSEARIILFAGGRGTGKLLALSTLVPTPTGWTKMGELEVGDVVFDEQGRTTKVLATYDAIPTDPVRLTFSDGATIDAGGEHQWVTLTAMERKRLNRKGKDIPDQWADKNSITTSELAATITYGKRGDANHCIPVTKPLQLSNADLPLDPWILGAWLGDGSSYAAAITCHDDDSEHYVREMAVRGVEMRLASRRCNDQPVGTWVFGQQPPQRDALGRMAPNGSITSLLNDMGVRGNKHIPSAYLRGSEKQRLDLLCGLIDTDGHISKSTGCVEFCSTKRELADGVVELATSLGQKPVLSIGDAKLYGRFTSKKYRVTWRPTIVVATLPRKVAAHHPLGAQKMRSAHRMIVSSEPIVVQPMRCITVDSPNSMYLVSEGMIPTHNTRVGAGWVNDKALNNPGCIIHLVGRTVADVRDVMLRGESGILAHALDEFQPVYTPSIRSVNWPNGSSALTFSADAPDQLRGPQSHYTWADELAAYPQRPDTSGLTIWDQIEISTRLGERPQILATTTPKRTTVIRDLFARAATGDSTFLVQGSSWENRSNLSKEYMEYIFNRYAGTHLERQELWGDLIGDSPGALWNESDIVLSAPPVSTELITVIGVDPAVTYGNDDTGIVVLCADTNPDPFKRRAWVLEDQTMNSPVEVWGKKVVELQRKYSRISSTNPRGAPAIVVVEKNQGHDLLKVLFKSEGMAQSAPVVDVSARVSKSQRAEPVVMAYRQGRVFHANDLPLLVDELTSWEPSVTKYSPGRLDALVWGLAVLLVDPRPIAQWVPILLSGQADYANQSLDGINQPWKKDRGIKTGLSVSPWRSR